MEDLTSTITLYYHNRVQINQIMRNNEVYKNILAQIAQTEFIKGIEDNNYNYKNRKYEQVRPQNLPFKLFGASKEIFQNIKENKINRLIGYKLIGPDMAFYDSLSRVSAETPSKNKYQSVYSIRSIHFDFCKGSTHYDIIEGYKYWRSKNGALNTVDVEINDDDDDLTWRFRIPVCIITLIKPFRHPGSDTLTKYHILFEQLKWFNPVDNQLSK